MRSIRTIRLTRNGILCASSSMQFPLRGRAEALSTRPLTVHMALTSSKSNRWYFKTGLRRHDDATGHPSCYDRGSAVMVVSGMLLVRHLPIDREVFVEGAMRNLPDGTPPNSGRGPSEEDYQVLAQRRSNYPNPTRLNDRHRLFYRRQCCSLPAGMGCYTPGPPRLRDKNPLQQEEVV
jgi:hypothetical protein